MQLPDYFEDVKLWKPKAGDVVVLKASIVMSASLMAEIRDMFRKQYPDTRLMILDKDMEMNVYEPHTDTGCRRLLDKEDVTEGVKLQPTDKEPHRDTIHPRRRTRKARRPRAEGADGGRSRDS